MLSTIINIATIDSTRIVETEVYYSELVKALFQISRKGRI